MSTGEIGLRHEDLAGAAQITIVQRGRVNKRLRGGNTMFFEHHYEHVGIHERAGVKQLHARILMLTFRAGNEI